MNSAPQLCHQGDGSMSADNKPIPRDVAVPNFVLRKKASGRRPTDGAQSFGEGFCRIPYLAGWRHVLVPLFLAVVTIAIGFADTTTEQILLPIEVLGANGTTVSRTVIVQAGQVESVRSLWLQIHGLRYADQASVQVNEKPWIPLNKNTVTIAEPGKSFGGIGGGFSTLVMTLVLPNGAVVGGDNTIRFPLNPTDVFRST